MRKVVIYFVVSNKWIKTPRRCNNKNYFFPVPHYYNVTKYERAEKKRKGKRYKWGFLFFYFPVSSQTFKTYYCIAWRRNWRKLTLKNIINKPTHLGQIGLKYCHYKDPGFFFAKQYPNLYLNMYCIWMPFSFSNTIC